MARGRMLNRTIGGDKAVHDLEAAVGPYGLVFYTWLLAHLDRDARVHGDPQVLKGAVCPRLDCCSLDVVEATLGEAHRLGLLIWYECEGDRYVEFPTFRKNQPGLRFDREPASQIPPPPDTAPEQTRNKPGGPPDGCRQTAGGVPAEEKRREGNVSEKKVRETRRGDTPAARLRGSGGQMHLDDAQAPSGAPARIPAKSVGTGDEYEQHAAAFRDVRKALGGR